MGAGGALAYGSGMRLVLQTLILLVLAGAVFVFLLSRRKPPPPAAQPPAAFKHLQPGKRYRVVRGFTDHDGLVHAPGETFVFGGYNFLPYDDGLTLLTEPGGSIRLQWRPEAQGAVVDELEAYIEAV